MSYTTFMDPHAMTPMIDTWNHTMTYIDDQDYVYFPYFECGIESVLMIAEQGLQYTGF